MGKNLPDEQYHWPTGIAGLLNLDMSRQFDIADNASPALPCWSVPCPRDGPEMNAVKYSMKYLLSVAAANRANGGNSRIAKQKYLSVVPTQSSSRGSSPCVCVRARLLDAAIVSR